MEICAEVVNFIIENARTNQNLKENLQFNYLYFSNFFMF